MKRILFLLLITFLFWSCCTTEYIEVPVEIKVELDEEELPKRQFLEPKSDEETIEQFLASRVLYWSELVKFWESWAVYVYETLDIPLPESLEYVIIKNTGE